MVRIIMQVSGRGARRKASRVATHVAIAALLATSAMAADTELPSGAQVLDAFAQAIGDKSAHNRIHSRVTRGNMSVVGSELAGDAISMWRDGSTYFAWSSPLGTFESGVSDGVAWEINPMVGARIKEGAEHHGALRMATLDHITNWRHYFREAKCVGVELVDGKSCYKVVISPTGESDITNYYDRDSGLHLKLETELDTPEGKRSVLFLIRDYREVDGVLVPHEITQTYNNLQTILMQTVSVEHNVEISDEQFALPEVVQSKLELRRTEHE